MLEDGRDLFESLRPQALSSVFIPGF
jgi:hypothetical protein